MIKLVREKIGLFASVILVFGLLSFTGNSSADNDNKEPNSNRIKTWKFASEDSLAKGTTRVLKVELEKTLIATYDLGIEYGKDNQEQLNIPISAYSSTTGLICGVKWKPLSIVVNRIDNKKFEYFVDGVMEWRLLGATIFCQSKEYSGIALTK